MISPYKADMCQKSEWYWLDGFKTIKFKQHPSQEVSKAMSRYHKNVDWTMVLHRWNERLTSKKESLRMRDTRKPIHSSSNPCITYPCEYETTTWIQSLLQTQAGWSAEITIMLEYPFCIFHLTLFVSFILESWNPISSGMHSCAGCWPGKSEVLQET